MSHLTALTSQICALRFWVTPQNHLWWDLEVSGENPWLWRDRALLPQLTGTSWSVSHWPFHKNPYTEYSHQPGITDNATILKRSPLLLRLMFEPHYCINCRGGHYILLPFLSHSLHVWRKGQGDKAHVRAMVTSEEELAPSVPIRTAELLLPGWDETTESRAEQNRDQKQ